MSSKLYALIEDGDVIELLQKSDISKEEWRAGKWLPVIDNSEGINEGKYHISSDFDLVVKRTRVVKTHEITPLNRRTKKLLELL